MWAQRVACGYDFHRPASGATHLSPLKARQSSGMAALAGDCLQTQEPGWNHHRHKNTGVFFTRKFELLAAKTRHLRTENLGAGEMSQQLE